MQNGQKVQGLVHLLSKKAGETYGSQRVGRRMLGAPAGSETSVWSAAPDPARVTAAATVKTWAAFRMLGCPLHLEVTDCLIQASAGVSRASILAVTLLFL